ncbi:hypothetical protein ACHAW5_004963 [Stephanodiscus triporus]|uniref:Amine oxidase n=1 Tax=Stephanodiscus triporus TaxID=2934178 RepID=A0ABD3MXX9_9STRA
MALSADGSRIRVAILGSGMTGCAVASTLLESSSSTSSSFVTGTKARFDVTVYEAGRGVGGRMSTRRDDLRGGGVGGRFQFDHGCQQIVGPAKTAEFAEALVAWRGRGCIAEWGGRFGRVFGRDDGDDEGGERTIVFEEETGGTTTTTTTTTRYVGHPRMSSICENLVGATASASDGDPDPSTVRVVTRTRARAIRSSYRDGTAANTWRMERSDEDGVVEALGIYDWVVATDLGSARSLLPCDDDDDDDDDKENSPSFKRMIGDVDAVPICSTMVTLDGPLSSLPADGIDIDHDSHPELMGEKFGTLGWIARDSSKPGRRWGGRGLGSDDDGREEYWILQSTRGGARVLLERLDLMGSTLEEIREEIRRTMVNDFMRAIPLLASVTANGYRKGGTEEEDADVLPTVIDSVGHRWGAAFPVHGKKNGDGDGNAFIRMDCHVDATRRFVACGDYFGVHHGNVEGAFLSGRAAANRLIRHVNTQSNASV